MPGGQYIITFAAMIMLTVTVMNLNNNLADSDINLSQNRYRMEALSIMNSYAEKAVQEYFDEASTDSTCRKQLTDFTLPANLGADAGDGGAIDDFDDYHKTAILDTGQSGVIYRLTFEVEYVQLSGQQLISASTPQYVKRMRISLTDNYADPIIYRNDSGVQIKDTLTQEVVYGYWFYN
ncbi:MAG: hypothetical protein AAFP70_16470 [Calditrichota bacterium]